VRDQLVNGIDQLNNWTAEKTPPIAIAE